MKIDENPHLEPKKHNYIVWSIVIAVRVQDQNESTEVILAAEDRTWNHPVLCIPDSHSIPKEILPMPMNLKRDLHLPVLCHTWLGDNKGLLLTKNWKKKALFIGNQQVTHHLIPKTSAF